MSDDKVTIHGMDTWVPELPEGYIPESAMIIVRGVTTGEPLHDYITVGMSHTAALTKWYGIIEVAKDSLRNRSTNENEEN